MQKNKDINPITLAVKYIRGDVDSIDITKLKDVKQLLISFLPKLYFKSPKAIYLLNKYVNHLYDNFTNNEDFQKYLDFLRFISKRMKFKYNDYHAVTVKKRNSAKYQIYEFFDKLYEYPLSTIEKSFLYELIIKYNLSDELNKIINANIKPKKLSDEELINLIKTSDISVETVAELYEFIYNKKQKKYYCKTCPLRDRQPLIENEKPVILDSNVSNLEDVKILIIGINPGIEEVKIGKPFIGRSGQKLREYISKYLNNTGYLITNVIMCATHNQEDLKSNLNKILKSCKYYQDIINMLPNLNLIILFGDIPKTAFNIKGRITQITERIFKYNNIDVIVLPHPSAILRQQKGKIIDSWKKGWEFINKHLDLSSNNIDLKIQKTDNKITEIKTINEIPKDETFFDVRILENSNKYLIIMIDKNGNKKYYLLPFKFIVYVNKNIFPQQCSYFENIEKLDQHIITDYNKLVKLRYTMNNKIKQLIKESK